MIQEAITVAVVLGHAVVLTIVLLQDRRQPTATLAWLLTLLFLPIVGVILYLLIGTTRSRRVARRFRRASARIDAVRAHFEIDRRLTGAAEAIAEPRTIGITRLGAAVATTPASAGNTVALLVDAAATYRRMRQAIEAAEHHVHVESYIIRDDDAGRGLRDHLCRRAYGGLQVRVLCDAVGSSSLRNEFWQPLREAGGRAAFFGTIGRALSLIRRRDRLDFRDHRKLVVCDGKVGFTGGLNIGREYLGLDPAVGAWRDTHLRMEGPAVLSLQCAFAETWFAATGEAIDDPEHFPRPNLADPGAIVQIVDSGPDRNWSPIERVYAYAIAHAQRRVWITNPYFLPSPSIEGALVAAALRGVDVRILVPEHFDHRLVHLAARSYFPRMLEAGARVYRYRRGFIHAKTMVVDEWVATIGSANMDMRSFLLNFELNPFVIDTTFCREVAAQFLDDLRRSEETSLEREAAAPLHLRLGSAFARLLSPLL